MSKEEILKEAAVKYYETMGLPENMAINAASELINNPSYKFTLTAMQTYAEQESVGFAEWLNNNCYMAADNQWLYIESNDYHTTSQLFKIWKDETGK